MKCNYKILMMILMSLFLFSACQKNAETTQTEQLIKLRVATPFKIQHLNPLKSGHYFLVEFGAAELPAKFDSDGKIKPWLLESFEQIDKLNWKLRLRPNIKFQNGKPLTAEIFARAMNRQIEKSAEAKVAIGEATAKTNDKNEIILTTKLPNPNVPAALADETAFPIYDVETVEAVGADSLKLVGSGVLTGAYKIITLDERQMSLERNEHYWQGKSPFDSVSILFVNDPQARILAVQNGELDISLYPQVQNKRLLENNNDAFFKLSDNSIGGPSLFFNVKNKPFDELKVRQAISYGINYESLANETMDKIYQTAEGFYAPNLAWAKKNQQTDVEQAKKILDESGWQIGADNFRQKDGVKLEAEILIYPQQADFSALATALQAQFQQIGFNLKIRQVEDIQSEVRTSKTWGLYILGNGNLTTGGAADPILQRYFLSSSDENHSGISDPKLDERIKTLSQTFETTERNKILGDIQDILITEKFYFVRLGFTRAKAVVSKKFKNYQPSSQMFHITFEMKAD